MAFWAAGLSSALLLALLIIGAISGLPGGELALLISGSSRIALVAAMTLAVALPFALLASIGRGYLLPLASALITLVLANVLVLIGWGDYFPWSIAGLYAQGSSPLPPISYGIVASTGLVGVLATCRWWEVRSEK